jgi:hypothetical protein
MGMAVDYQGIAVLVGALGGVTTAVGSLVIQGVILFRQRAQTAKLDEVHTLVNGQSHALSDALGKVSYAAGKEAGRDAAQSEQARDPRNGTA